MRSREKNCFNCKNKKPLLYRCRLQSSSDWIFLCDKCLKIVKKKYEDTYQYGGTWKSKKK